ncbi:hypothetical protein NC651_001414 [Populus alba x Populus x berolinensis]|nr:hypothetical protein NC651_001414 [Populus alba x Populus x berolinensis]
MRFSYFSYNQDQDDQEKEKVPSFSPSDYNHVDERRDKLEYDDNDDDLDHYNNTGDFKINMYGLFEVYDDDDLEHYYDIKDLLVLSKWIYMKCMKYMMMMIWSTKMT